MKNQYTIPDEILDQIVCEMSKEMNVVLDTKKNLTFDDIEKTVYDIRNEMGKKLMTKILDYQNTKVARGKKMPQMQ